LGLWSGSGVREKGKEPRSIESRIVRREVTTVGGIGRGKEIRNRKLDAEKVEDKGKENVQGIEKREDETEEAEEAKETEKARESVHRGHLSR
jgi:hypothetical protein